MDSKDMITMLLSGSKPVIEFMSGIEDMEGADPGMRAQITSVIETDVDCAEVYVDLKPYEAHNMTAAVRDWDHGKIWQETAYYRDGKWSFFIDTSGHSPMPFRLVSDRSEQLMTQFLTEKPGTSYIEWLESKIP